MNIWLTPRADPPRVVINVTSMPQGTASVIVERVSGAGDPSPVRGATDVPVQGTQAWTVTDWEAPLGRETLWRATPVSASGGKLAAPVSRTLSIPHDDCDTAWLTNPYDPSASLLVTLMAGTDDDTTHAMPVSLSPAARRTGLPTAVAGNRRLGGDRTLVLRCETLDAAQRLEDMLARSVTLLVRSTAIRHRTGCLYMVVGEAVEHRDRQWIDADEDTTWTLRGDEVDPGRLPVLVQPWTYAAGAEYVTQQSRGSTYAYAARVYPLYLDATKGV